MWSSWNSCEGCNHCSIFLFLLFSLKKISSFSLQNVIWRSQHAKEAYNLIKLYRWNCHFKYFFRTEVEEEEDNMSLGACEVEKAWNTLLPWCRWPSTAQGVTLPQGKFFWNSFWRSSARLWERLMQNRVRLGLVHEEICRSCKEKK